MAFREDSTGTYTFPSNSTGSTVDLGARNTYRYVNATNVYNKGKSDAAISTVIYQIRFTTSNLNPAAYQYKYTATAAVGGDVTIIDYKGELTYICDNNIRYQYNGTNAPGWNMWANKPVYINGTYRASGYQYITRAPYNTLNTYNCTIVPA